MATAARVTPVPPGPDDAAESARDRERRFRDVEQITRRNWSFVHHVITSSVRQPWEAEELTQEVFARAMPHLVVSEDDDRVRAYLAQTARNLLRDRWRHRQYVTLEQGVPDAAGVEPDPETRALEGADRTALIAALARLPEEQRQVLRLRLMEGLPAAEVAARMGRNADSIRQIQHRALIKLRQEYLGIVEPGEGSLA
jgi:RNA polymerase sigma-70 factor, ECF subfamily